MCVLSSLSGYAVREDDVSAEMVWLSVFWHYAFVAGLLLGTLPPVIISTIITWVDLEGYRQSAIGRSLKVNMTPLAVTLRILGTIVSHTGA